MTEIEAIAWVKDMADHFAIQEETQELAEAMYMCADAMKFKESVLENYTKALITYYDGVRDGCNTLVKEFQKWVCLETEPNRIMFYYTDILRKLKQISREVGGD